ncbi:unnamed protein product, partial [Lymnaea stagnalis]
DTKAYRKKTGAGQTSQLKHEQDHFRHRHRSNALRPARRRRHLHPGPEESLQRASLRMYTDRETLDPTRHFLSGRLEQQLHLKVPPGLDDVHAGQRMHQRSVTGQLGCSSFHSFVHLLVRRCGR